jgi:TolA-binding protein
MNRLALGYAELERRAEADQAQQPKGSPEADKAEKIVNGARAAAAKYYANIVERHRDWCAVPNPADPRHGTGCRDTSLYYLALTFERGGHLDSARKAYLDLLQSFPDSRFVPLAYLAFAEMFVDEARHDPSRIALAFQGFQEVAKYPPPDNPAYAWAKERMVQLREAAQKRGVTLDQPVE